MLSLVRLVRSAVIAVGLASLATVLVPQYTEPLWNWGRTLTGVVANDPPVIAEQLRRWSG